MSDKLDLTKPVQTRDERKVRILCTDAKGDVYKIVGLVDRSGIEIVDVWTIDGKHRAFADVACEHDLINVPPKPAQWEVTVELVGSCALIAQASLGQVKDPSAIARKVITIAIGEGL